MNPAQQYRHDRKINWRQHPEFEASLREIVGRQQYTLDDVAIMFGLSRERVRSFCWKFKIATQRTHRRRVWNDATHEFGPGSPPTRTFKEQAATEWAARQKRIAHREQQLKDGVPSSRCTSHDGNKAAGSIMLPAASSSPNRTQDIDATNAVASAEVRGEREAYYEKASGATRSELRRL
jgi:hypothetical protein